MTVSGILSAVAIDGSCVWVMFARGADGLQADRRGQGISRRMDVGLSWQGEHLQLCAERAVWWPVRQTLLIADPHFGKAAAFRAAGIPVPDGGTAADLARLTRLIERVGASRLVILGDLFHARSGRSIETMTAIGAWRRQHARLDIVLIRGNHDRLAGAPPDEWRFACPGESWVEGLFRFAHEPPVPVAASDSRDDDSPPAVQPPLTKLNGRDKPAAALPAARSKRRQARRRAAAARPHTGDRDALQRDHQPCSRHIEPVFAGHIHPVVRLQGRFGGLRAPCFWFQPDCATLPAFGSFTGGHRIVPARGDRVFVVLPDGLVEARTEA